MNRRLEQRVIGGVCRHVTDATPCLPNLSCEPWTASINGTFLVLRCYQRGATLFFAARSDAMRGLRCVRQADAP
jgi:hypothetical protein